jgi:hypothetical protein
MLSPPVHSAGWIEPCLPTPSRTVPDGPHWAYEIKHDGYRFVARRDGDRAIFLWVTYKMREAENRGLSLPQQLRWVL